MAKAQSSGGASRERSKSPITVAAQQRLQTHIETCGLTQKEVGERVGLTQGHVSKILSEPRPSFDAVVMVAVSAGMPLEQLIAGLHILTNETPVPSSAVRDSSRP